MQGDKIQLLSSSNYVWGIILVECQFEEKQFEQHLNSELARNGRIYVPGQVLENKIAIDAAVFSKNPRFWELMRGDIQDKQKLGVFLQPELWDLIEDIWKDDLFPKFKCNLFIQHKRPEYIKSKLGKEYGYWKQPYFRYDLDYDQQKTLLLLEQKISSQGLVVYACPAFWERKDLWRFIKGKMVENTNFVKSKILGSHKRYTFIQSGKNGLAFSKPNEISSIEILEETNKLIDEAQYYEDNIKFIEILSKKIHLLIEDIDYKTRNDFYTLKEQIRFPENNLGYNIFNIQTFNMVTNTTWAIGYKIDPPEDIYDISLTNGRILGLIDSLDFENIRQPPKNVH